MNDLFWEDKAVDEVVSDSIEHLYYSFLNKLDELEIEKLEIPFATSLSIAKLHTLMNLATLEYDGTVQADCIFEKLEADGEPYPNTIDSWARGIVSTKKVAGEESSFRRGIPASQSGTPSVSSFRSSATGKSRTTTGSKSYRSVQSKQQDRMDKSGQIIELDNELDNEFSDLAATGAMFNLLQKQKKNKILGYYQDSEGSKGEFEVLQEQLQKATKDVKGKKFVLDRYGQPVIIGKVDPHQLPSFTASLHHAIKVDEEYSKGVQKGSDEDQNGSNKLKKRQFVRVAGSRGVEENSFEPTLSLATSLSGVESIPKINPGVTVKSKTAVKSGDAIAEDPKHMSRKTYLSKTINVVPSLSSGEFPSYYDKVGKTTSKTVSTFDKSPTKGSVFSETFQSLDNLPDINPLEGSRSIALDEMIVDPSDDELGLGPTKTIGQAKKIILPSKPSQQQKANITLLSNSPEHGKPRDRDLLKNMKSTGEKKHLPPPPLGYSTGHGIIATEGRQTNSTYSNSVDSHSSQWFARRSK